MTIARTYIHSYIYISLSLPWRTILFPVHTTIFIIGLYLLVLPGADRILAQSINQIVCIAIGHSPILLMIHCVSYIVRFMFDQFCFGCVRRYQHCLLIGTVKPSSFNEFLFICCCCLFFFFHLQWLHERWLYFWVHLTESPHSDYLFMNEYAV